MVGKGGVIRDKDLQKSIVSDLIAHFKESGLAVHGTFESPIRGTKGNREFFIYLKYR
jgi:23S rRNA (cytidine1920-2'-O)/16S rRNA (cytidine1409-2'-O)-methyltransferase